MLAWKSSTKLKQTYRCGRLWFVQFDDIDPALARP